MAASNKAIVTNKTTADGLTIYDLDPQASELWAVAGPAGVDPATLDPDALPDGFRWVDSIEWEDICERIEGVVVINHERYGERAEFDSLDAATEAIRDMGDEFEDVTLTIRGDNVVDERGDVVGSVYTQSVKAIRDVLVGYGDVFTGGINKAYDVAEEWEFDGFTAEQVEEWAGIGVWDADAADVWRGAGLTPTNVKHIADAMVDASNDPDAEFTDGCPIYAACNGDINPSRFVEFAKSQAESAE